MAAKIPLLPNEAIIFRNDSVMHGGIMAPYTDELVLTNMNVIYVKKGIVGNVKRIQKFPLDQITMYNGEPQAILGKQHNGSPQLEIYFMNGQQENFAFQSGGKKKVNQWINEICKAVTGHESSAASKSGGILGAGYLAGTIKGTVDTFKGVLGAKPKEQAPVVVPVTKKCISCSAPLSGNKGETVQCRYCDTEQVL